MQKQNEKPQSMLEAILETPSDKERIKQGSLPESCETWLDTALNYAQRARGECAGLKAPINSLDVVIGNLKKIQEKVEATKK